MYLFNQLKGAINWKNTFFNAIGTQIKLIDNLIYSKSY